MIFLVVFSAIILCEPFFVSAVLGLKKTRGYQTIVFVAWVIPLPFALPLIRMLRVRAAVQQFFD